MTELVFRHADFDVLPVRGRFTADEVLEQWLDECEALLADNSTGLSARAALRTVHEIDRDIRLLLPHLDNVLHGDRVTLLHDRRDALMEVARRTEQPSQR